MNNFYAKILNNIGIVRNTFTSTPGVHGVRSRGHMEVIWRSYEGQIKGKGLGEGLNEYAGAKVEQ